EHVQKPQINRAVGRFPCPRACCRPREGSLELDRFGPVPGKPIEATRFGAPLLRADVIRGQCSVIESHSRSLGLSGAKIHPGETFQLLGRPRYSGVPVSYVHLGDISACAAPAVGHVERYLVMST